MQEDLGTLRRTCDELQASTSSHSADLARLQERAATAERFESEAAPQLATLAQRVDGLAADLRNGAGGGDGAAARGLDPDADATGGEEGRQGGAGVLQDVRGLQEAHDGICRQARRATVLDFALAVFTACQQWRCFGYQHCSGHHVGEPLHHISCLSSLPDRQASAAPPASTRHRRNEV